MEKDENHWNQRKSYYKKDIEKVPGFSTTVFKRCVFHIVVFLFHRCTWKTQCLELMLVLISFTVSEKAASDFICFSTFSME